MLCPASRYFWHMLSIFNSNLKDYLELCRALWPTLFGIFGIYYLSLVFNHNCYLKLCPPSRDFWHILSIFNSNLKYYLELYRALSPTLVGILAFIIHL